MVLEGSLEVSDSALWKYMGVALEMSESLIQECSSKKNT